MLPFSGRFFLSMCIDSFQNSEAKGKRHEEEEEGTVLRLVHSYYKKKEKKLDWMKKNIFSCSLLIPIAEKETSKKWSNFTTETWGWVGGWS